MGDSVEFNRLFGKYIKYSRIENDLTQQQLAEYSQLSTNNIGQIERGETEPKNYSIYKLEQALNINIHQIYKKIREELNQQESE